MPSYRSHKGKIVDMDALIAQNSKQIAAGNMHVNVRGDLIGRGGKIIKTKEQMQAEIDTATTAYYDKNPNAVPTGPVTVSLNDSLDKMIANVGENPSTKTDIPVTFTQKNKTKKSDKNSLDKFDTEEAITDEVTGISNPSI